MKQINPSHLSCKSCAAIHCSYSVFLQPARNGRQREKDDLCYSAFQKAMNANMIRATSALVVCTAVWLVGCVASQQIEPNPIGKVLLGKSRHELIACAGNPLQEAKTAEGTVLSYYKEAPMFEESVPFLKGSRPGAHHGCWAHLLMEEDRVIGAEYRSVPRSIHATDHCEEMFRACVP